MVRTRNLAAPWPTPRLAAAKCLCCRPTSGSESLSSSTTRPAIIRATAVCISCSRNRRTGTPDAVAVEFGDQRLTYRELNSKANQLAHHLRGLGVGPEVLVGICVERSLEMVSGLLGILKAGGAYLPLDPETPPQRLAFMLADGRVRLVLTQTSLCNRLESTGVQLLCLDASTDSVSGQSQADLRCSAGAENLAYVIYTSGSTGVPKGVEIPHRAINRLLFGVDYARFDASLRVAQLAPISFDASTLEIWGPLLHGGCCVLFSPGVPDFAELEQGLRRHRIQTLWLTASLFNAILDERPQTLRGVEQLLIGGEALSLSHVRRALRFARADDALDQRVRSHGIYHVCLLLSDPGDAAHGIAFGSDRRPHQ